MTTGHEEIIGDGVLVVTIDHPPVNAIATPVRRLLFEALQRATNDPRVRAVVVTGNARLFSAGADLGEFAAGTAMDPPSLHADILPLVASMTKPVVAAVRRAALGGGFELALGCHDRVFAEATRVGLPETTLGLMPGAGGTQMLPRAIWLGRAIDLIAGGQVVAIEAIAGPALARAIVPAERLLASAIARAAELAGLPVPFRAIEDRPVVDPDGERGLADAKAAFAARAETLPGVLRALDAIALTTSTTIADGMRAEFAMFEPLLASVESRALRHVFLAERRRPADADVARFERAFAERVDARLEGACAALVRSGVDATSIARTIAHWRTGAAQPPGDTATAAHLLGAMIDEGRAALDAGEAASEADLDVALVRAGRFARVSGGPFFQARILGIDRGRQAARHEPARAGNEEDETMNGTLETLRADHAARPLPRTMMDRPLGVTDILLRAEQLFPDIALICRHGPADVRRTSYGAMAGIARRLATALRELDLPSGARVATLMWNHAEHLAAFHATPVVDAVLHPLNPRLSPDELAYIVADAGDSVLLLDEDLLPLWAQVAERVRIPHVIVNGDGAAARASGLPLWDTVVGEAEPMTAWPTSTADENAAISVCYTSGTTGRPKGVVCTHRSVLLHGLAIATPDALALSGRDTILLLTPMFHVNGWSMPYTVPMFGAKLVLPGPRITSSEVLDLMVDEQVDCAFGVPTFWNDVLQTMDREPGRWTFAPGTRLNIGGAPPPADLFRRFDRLGVRVQTGWGMTECSPIGTQTWLQRKHDALDAEARIAVRTGNGIPLPFVEMRHVDDAGTVLPRDGAARGELQVRGPWITRGYVGWPEPLPATTADGWLHTADIVTIAPDGYMRLVDRLKDLVKSGGEWISSVEMENALTEHPDVHEAAVIAVPDERWGERPLAVIAARPDAVLDEAALQAHLATRMPKWMIPERMAFVDAIPRTGIGKVDKVALRRRYGAG